MACPAPFAKIFPFSPDPNQMHIHCRLVPTRGAIARRHERGAGCGGRESVRRATAVAGRDEPRERSAACKMIGALADGEAVSFRHPLLVPSWRRRNQARPGLISLNPPVTVTTRIRSPGRARYKLLKPLRGECRVYSGVPVVTTLVCFINFARESAGGLGTRDSLRPLFSWANN